MKKQSIGAKSLALHKKLGGKIRIQSAVSVKNRDDLSLIYTPGVGAVSSYVAQHPKEVKKYTGKGRMIAVISDGSAVLGLGNIGPYGALPVMEGKCVLFKARADVDAVPLVLDVHDPEEIIRTIKAIAPAFGGINLEDIAAPACFEVERRLIDELDIPVMHDDQHGTAIVVLAGLLNAAKVTQKNLRKLSVVISGAGAAGTAVAKLLLSAGVKDIIVLDRTGVIYADRPDVSVHKKELAASTNPRKVTGGLAEAMNGADVFIGLSGKGVLEAEHVAAMAPKGIVFALANPDPEILPDVAKKAGAAVVATGRSDFPNQINNALVFPGIFRGALDKGVQKITESTKLRAARALAALVPKPTAVKIIPDLLDPRVVKAVARAVH